jgi:hypothetical protein
MQQVDPVDDRKKISNPLCCKQITVVRIRIASVSLVFMPSFRHQQGGVMNHSSESQSPFPQDPQSPRNSRYRYSRGSRLDPSEGLHPELSDAAQDVSVGAGIPNTPQDLIAMQTNDNSDNERSERPEKPGRQKSAKVSEVLELIGKLNTSGLEDQQIAISLVLGLESFHDSVVEEMREDNNAKHSQIIAWSIDADRLMRSWMLLESIDLD